MLNWPLVRSVQSVFLDNPFIKVPSLFILAGFLEIGGGYLIWQFIKDSTSPIRPLYLIGGIICLVLYGIVPTLQGTDFGRIYAAYGGFFIAIALVWGKYLSKQPLDRGDIVGGVLAITGAVVIYFWRGRV